MVRVAAHAHCEHGHGINSLAGERDLNSITGAVHRNMRYQQSSVGFCESLVGVFCSCLTPCYGLTVAASAREAAYCRVFPSYGNGGSPRKTKRTHVPRLTWIYGSKANRRPAAHQRHL